MMVLERSNIKKLSKKEFQKLHCELSACAKSVSTKSAEAEIELLNEKRTSLCRDIFTQRILYDTTREFILCIDTHSSNLKVNFDQNGYFEGYFEGYLYKRIFYNTLLYYIPVYVFEVDDLSEIIHLKMLLSEL